MGLMTNPGDKMPIIHNRPMEQAFHEEFNLAESVLEKVDTGNSRLPLTNYNVLQRICAHL
jgi:hypothetical protein